MLQRMLTYNSSVFNSVSNHLRYRQARITHCVTAPLTSSSSSSSSSDIHRVIPCLSRTRRRRQCNWHQLKATAAAAADVEQLLDADAAGYATYALDGPMSWPARSHGAGSVSEAEVGNQITVCGWVDRNRNLGGLGFMDLRDHTGLLQVMLYNCDLPDSAKPHKPQHSTAILCTVLT